MDKDKIIKDAQFRKGLSISYFNSLNAAINLVTINPAHTDDEILAQVCKYRDFFLEQHKEYYATVIANVGVAFDVAKTIEKIKSSTTLEELKNNWTSISAEERHNEEVRKVAKELKLTLK